MKKRLALKNKPRKPDYRSLPDKNLVLKGKFKVDPSIFKGMVGSKGDGV